MAVTLSRLATDLQLWSTAEFGFVEFPDRLVGGSSAMPQKRNAFLLEHVKAKSGQAVGAWSAAASMMACTPFTNSIEVGTDAVAGIWPGLLAARRVGVAEPGAGRRRPAPTPERMRRARRGRLHHRHVAGESPCPARRPVPRPHTTWSARRFAWRSAAGSTDLAAFGPPGWLDGIDGADLTLPALVHAQAYGGGPGAFDEPFADAADAWCGASRQWHADDRGVSRPPRRRTPLPTT